MTKDPNKQFNLLKNHRLWDLPEQFKPAKLIKLSRKLPRRWHFEQTNILVSGSDRRRVIFLCCCCLPRGETNLIRSDCILCYTMTEVYSKYRFKKTETKDWMLVHIYKKNLETMLKSWIFVREKPLTLEKSQKFKIRKSVQQKPEVL